MLFLAHIVYLLCVATSLVCMVLLVRGYLASRSRLLLWSALCFVGLAVNNLLLFMDLVIFPSDLDLSGYRLATSFGAVSLLLVGLIWEAD
jgi:heme/copper-type cytochrome/quinol oxidase subunit 4